MKASLYSPNEGTITIKGNLHIKSCKYYYNISELYIDDIIVLSNSKREFLANRGQLFNDL